MEASGANRLVKLVDGKKQLCVSYSQIEMFKQCPYKWYLTYVKGIYKEQKQEALSYGSAIHKTLEFFFNNKKMILGQRLADAMTYYLYQEDVPWNSTESMLEGGRDALSLVGWISKVCRYHNGKYDIPDNEIGPFGFLVRYGKVVGVEESFFLPYRLPEPIEILGDSYNEVWINGSVDLHLSLERKGSEEHYVIDWKSGRKTFDEKKLQTNLQHPIYSFYILRRYGVLPKNNLYFFTRLLEYQKVLVDKERVKKSVEDLNSTFSDMYEINKETVSDFNGYFEDWVGGYKKYGWRGCTLNSPVKRNMRPCPSALCYYCDFGKHGSGECPYSSDWDPSKKKQV